MSPFDSYCLNLFKKWILSTVIALINNKMLPLYKLFSLIVRVFARPLVNYTKKYHISNQSNENNHLKRFFVWFGKLIQLTVR